jgi:hypothetical protein
MLLVLLFGIYLFGCANAGCTRCFGFSGIAYGPNTEFSNCGNVCEINCYNYGSLTNGTYDDSTDCKPGFYCIRGYILDSSGFCVPSKDACKNREYNFLTTSASICLNSLVWFIVQVTKYVLIRTLNTLGAVPNVILDVSALPNVIHCQITL